MRSASVPLPCLGESIAGFAVIETNADGHDVHEFFVIRRYRRSGIGQRVAPLWNRTWLKESATVMAEGTEDAKPVPAVGRWNRGEGRVLAVAFDPGAAAAETLVAAVARSPHCPLWTR